MRLDRRLQLLLILAAAVALRLAFFVGFGLGDDLGYIAHADTILSGDYPPLDPLNQYAYRPLLLLLFAAGIALFGHTDLGIVAPVLLLSLVTTALVFLFVRRLIDPGAACWCAVLYACEPFTVVNSTTMTNDVILACLTFASTGLFLTADQAPATARGRMRFAAAGVLMLAAYLVKITIVPIACALALYTLVALRRRPAAVFQGHAVFYATVLLGLALVCTVYYVLKGDFFWQFKAETFYYQTHKPNWYEAGAIDYAALMWQYPRSLFGLSGYPGFRYLEHGLLFWVFVPSALAVLLWWRDRVLTFLVVVVVVVFAFFQFYPQYVTPHYLPLVRQERYLEMLVPPAAVIVGTMLWRLHRRHAAVAVAVLAVLLGDFVLQASRRHFEYDDSQQDVRELARYAASTIPHAGAPLVTDRPAANALSFYLGSSPVRVVPIAAAGYQDVSRAYVAVGGARSFWWSRAEVIETPSGWQPEHWVLAYQVAGRPTPWRPSHLRVYYAGEPPEDWHTTFTAPGSVDATGAVPGLAYAAYPDGFEGEPVPLGADARVPDLDSSSRLAAARLEWTAWMRAEGAVYVFETTSDDGSWIHLNDELLIDNGGTHPARTMRRTVRLAEGWYRFRLRYEDTGGDRLLRLRIYRDGRPSPVDQRTLFFWSPAPASP